MSAVPGRFDQSLSIPARDAEGLVRLIEAAPGVRRRYQFFVWMQTYVSTLLPHAVLVCGAWRRQLRDLAWEVFNGVVVDEAAIAQLSATGSAPMQQALRRWLESGGGPATLPLHELRADADARERPAWDALADAGVGHLLVHGVSRPDRPSEVESLFLFASSGSGEVPTRSYYLELLLPHLHAVYQRVQSTERELGALPPRVRAGVPEGAGQPWPLTDRELQILHWVREGFSNQQIGERLSISALTVKNHVQKILRKMGASNRAQAVSLAITANLLKSPRGERAGPH